MKIYSVVYASIDFFKNTLAYIGILQYFGILIFLKYKVQLNIARECILFTFVNNVAHICMHIVNFLFISV